MKTRVLSMSISQARRAAFCICGRKRMRNRIAKDAEANRRINVARYLSATSQDRRACNVGWSAFIGLSLQSFRAKSRDLMVEHGQFRVISFDSASLRSG